MKNFYNSSIFSKEEQELAKDLFNSVTLGSTKNEISYFLTAAEQHILEKIIAYDFKDARLEFFGGYDEAERKRAKIIVNDFYDIDYNIVCLKASFNKKFHNIGHRDVMGALYNQGININRLGDLIVNENEIYIFCDMKIADYVKTNLSRIGKAVLDFEFVDDMQGLDIEKQFTSLTVVCSSHRLDSIVSKIINKSRSKVKEMLQKELVKVNHIVVTSGEKVCNKGDLLSIRKYGRYVVKDSTQNSKSLKYRITVDKVV